MTDPELDDRLAELLVGYQTLTPDLVSRAREFQRARGSTLAGALAELHLVPSETIGILLQELTGARAVDPTLLTVYPDFVEQVNALIPPELVGRLLVFPVQAEVNGIHVCMLNPTDGWTARSLEAMSGCRVHPMVAHEMAIVDALEKHYSPYLHAKPTYQPDAARGAVEGHYKRLLEEPLDQFVKPAAALVNRNRDAIARDPHALEATIRDPVIIRLVQQLLARAIELGASDVHVEPTGTVLRVRLRVDGAMRAFAEWPENLAAPICARLKSMAELPIGTATAPLDGRIGYDLVLGRGVDLRFSLVPSVSGEKIVLRVLDRTRERRRLVDLGVDTTTRTLIEDASDLPNGLILVTGPTGSGKSSTLYALLDRLNDVSTAVLTAEDPVESRVLGVTQVQCDEASGVTFATALRSFLRQDPDVIMVGEIRDAETADIALKAALTGHVVLSTLHTNDAPGAVLRLVNMNLEPFVIASSLRLVVAQRLVRALCRECRRAVSPHVEPWRSRLEALGPSSRPVFEAGTFFEPVGCPACRATGYRGRTGIFEVLQVTPHLEEMIVNRVSTSTLRTAAKAEGMRTLRQAALLKVAAGETSIGEVIEHTVSDEEIRQGVAWS